MNRLRRVVWVSIAGLPVAPLPHPVDMSDTN